MKAEYRESLKLAKLGLRNGCLSYPIGAIREGIYVKDAKSS